MMTSWKTRLLAAGVMMTALWLTGCDGDSTTSGGCDSSASCPVGFSCEQRDDFGNKDPFARGRCVETECLGDRDCFRGEVCLDGVCYEPGGPGGGDTCERNRDCDPGSVCVGGQCVADEPDATPDTTPDVCEGAGCEDPDVIGGDTGDDTDTTPDDVNPPPTCEPACADGFVCRAGQCEPASTDTCTPACAAGQVCQGGRCVVDTSGCDLTPADCTTERPYLTVRPDGTCTCVGCTRDQDCNTAVGEVCITGQGTGRCLYTTGQTCSSRTDCGTGYCQAGRCTQCLSETDCQNPGDICIRGRCGACTCPEGFACDRLGNCVEQSVVDPRRCNAPTDCYQAATAAGYTGDFAAIGCDPTAGCYLRGSCNGILGGNDPFNAACGSGSSCEAPLSLFSFFEILMGGGIASSCSCQPGTPGQCRQGESCEPRMLFGGLIPDPAGGHSCRAPGGGGFPLPF